MPTNLTAFFKGCATGRHYAVALAKEAAAVR